MKQLFFHELKQNVRWDIYMTLLWLKKWNINDLAFFTEIVNSRLFLQKSSIRHVLQGPNHSFLHIYLKCNLSHEFGEQNDVNIKCKQE